MIPIFAVATQCASVFGMSWNPWTRQSAETRRYTQQYYSLSSVLFFPEVARSHPHHCSWDSFQVKWRNPLSDLCPLRFWDWYEKGTTWHFPTTHPTWKMFVWVQQPQMHHRNPYHCGTRKYRDIRLSTCRIAPNDTLSAPTKSCPNDEVKSVRYWHHAENSVTDAPFLFPGR